MGFRNLCIEIQLEIAHKGFQFRISFRFQRATDSPCRSIGHTNCILNLQSYLN